jgi:hypothetical protein
MSGTLNAIPLTRAALWIPSWGIPVADVVVASGEEQSGAAELELGGLRLRGTIVSGGVYQNEGRYRLVAGAAGWRKTLAARSYKNAAGLKLATVLADAASEAGEQLGAVDQTKRIRKEYVRQRGAASLVLDELARDGWYVDNDGITQIGARSTVEFATPYTLMDKRTDRNLVTVAAEDISALVPGATLEGITATSVRHELTESTLRSHVWGVVAGDRLLVAFRKLVEWIMGRAFYLGSYEYVVRSHSGGYADVDPSDPKLGLPKLANVAVRSGVPGGGGESAAGATCLVRFINGDPTRPFVADFEGEYGPNWAPVKCRVGGDDELVRNAPFAQWVSAVESGVVAAGGTVSPPMATIAANPAYGPHATQITRGA